MTSAAYDVIVLGSGFGGSLLSTILTKSGLSVAMVDRSKHPRFAIGESSTPLADVTLRQLAEMYDLPELLPLTKYGSWKTECSEIVCGLKRGFSYFGHSSDADSCADHQLLVAASRSDEMSDTHWLRSDVDHHFFKLAAKHGVTVFEEVQYRLQSEQNAWRIEGTSCGESIDLRAPFVVDATGNSRVVLQTLGIADQTNVLRTNSRAIYAHFRNVRRNADVLDEFGVDQKPHPFDCDAAAVHHILDDGWMWQLRFNDDTVSAGLVIGGEPSSLNDSLADPVAAWNDCVNRYPFLQRQFASAEVVRPAGGLCSTGRLQRLTTQAAGDNWAALPGTAGIIDPLHSTGIAHTLFGVRRLAAILTASKTQAVRSEQLREYSDDIIAELQLVDELVEGCYAALPNFQLWSDWCMLYFAAVTSMEQASAGRINPSFLRANDYRFRGTLRSARTLLQGIIIDGATDIAGAEFRRQLRTLIQPFSNVGLLDDSCNGMYISTAAN